MHGVIYEIVWYKATHKPLELIAYDLRCCMDRNSGQTILALSATGYEQLKIA